MRRHRLPKYFAHSDYYPMTKKVAKMNGIKYHYKTMTLDELFTRLEVRMEDNDLKCTREEFDECLYERMTFHLYKHD